MGETMSIIPAEDPPATADKAASPSIVLHKFVKSDSWRGALTPDPKGENLPRHGSPWIYAKDLVVAVGDRRIGATSGEIMKGIAERGYFLLPISDDA
jgi:hypothetical protein